MRTQFERLLRPVKLLGAAAVTLVLIGAAVVGGSYLGTLRQELRESALASGKPPIATARPSNPKVEAAARGTPAPPHIERRFPAASAADILANLRGDADFARLMGSLTAGSEADPRAAGKTVTLGAPVLARGLGANATDRFMVPLLVDGKTVAISWVVVDRVSKVGYVGGMRGWSETRDWPKFSEADARLRASVAGDPVVTTELVWAYVRGAADEYAPFWRLVRAGGEELYLFESGALLPAKDVPIGG